MSEEYYGPDVLTLVDEDGVEHEFEVLDTLELENDRLYVALAPTRESEDDDGELVILKVIEEDDEEILEVIEDDDEFNEVSAQFMARLEDEYEFEE